MTSTRFFAAMVGLGVILPLIFWGGAWGVGLVVVVAVLIGLDEYARMAFPTRYRVELAWMSCWALCLMAPALSPMSPIQLVAVAAMALVAMGARAVASPVGADGPGVEGAADTIGRTVLGVVWIAGLFPFVARLGAMQSGPYQVLLALGISWAGDTAAYFAGRQFGRHPLHPVVSPKKTVEGYVGGLLGSIVWVATLRATALPHLGWPDVVVLGAVGGSAGVVGDLFESLLKRSFHVKDSGWIMPGHGGLLDRIDSVLFVAPVVWVWQVVVRGFV